MSESACGGANSSNDDRDKSVVCPECDRSDFASAVGLSMHLRRTHDIQQCTYSQLDDADWLKARYWNDYMSQSEIADLVGCSGRTVSEKLREHGIETRNSQRGNVLDGGLTDSQKSVLVGELLGDGCIYTRYENSTSAMYCHTTSRKKYRDWLANWLSDVGFEVSTRMGDNGYGGDSYCLSTKGYRCLYELYEKWYPGGTKAVPQSLQLTPLSLRHWYIGDGSHLEEWRQVRLHTEGFSQDGLRRLQRALSWKGIPATIQDCGALFIPTDYYERFFDYTAQLPSELKSVYGYKWP